MRRTRQDGGRERARLLAGLLATGAALALGAPAPVAAGSYLFAGESNGVDLICHPQGYTGSQTSLQVDVCIDPTTEIPAGATLDEFETPVRNTVEIWNQMQPLVENVLRGSTNNMPSGSIYDVESVLLHEVGHCIGLAHVNLASESGLSGNDQNYTKSTDGGPPNEYDIDDGADNVIGTYDDLRGDDVSLHWYRIDTNDPGELPLPVPVDAMTFARDSASLPSGHSYAQNLDRTAAAAMGHPSTFPVETEAVMQQLSWNDEDQRRLTADGVATILLAQSGVDETAGTGDDYVLTLVYGGIQSGCDINVTFDSSAGFAFCSVGGSFIGSSGHARITSASIELDTDAVNWFFNQDGPCRQEIDLPQNQWKQIGLSCEPDGAADTVDDVFGDDLSGTYDVDWVLFERDEINDTYRKMATTDAVEVGEGYWIIHTQAGQTVHVEGDFIDPIDIPLEADPSGRANKVGYPYWWNFDWEDVRVVDGASVLTLDQADPAGACQGADPVANGCIMSRIGYRWNGAAYEAFDGQTPGAEGTVRNLDGIWVFAYKSGIELRFPDRRSTPDEPRTESLVISPAAPSSAPGVGPAPEAMRPSGAALGATDGERHGSKGVPGEGDVAGDAAPLAPPVPQPWFVRLIVASDDLVDRANILGELTTASDGYDAHDLEEPAPFGSRYLTVVFPQADWGTHAGDYATDFRRLAARPGAQRQSWGFDVLTSEIGSQITLSWEAPGEILRGAFLIDEQTGKRIRPKAGGSYTFTATAARTSFTWQKLH